MSADPTIIFSSLHFIDFQLSPVKPNEISYPITHESKQKFFFFAPLYHGGNPSHFLSNANSENNFSHLNAHFSISQKIFEECILKNCFVLLSTIEH